MTGPGEPSPPALWPVPFPPPNAASLGRFLCGTVNDFVAEVGRAYKRATENKQEAELMARKVREGEIWGIWGACPGVQPQEGWGPGRDVHPTGVHGHLGCSGPWGAPSSARCPGGIWGARAFGVSLWAPRSAPC